MSDLIRAFIAVTLPEPLVGLVSEVQKRLKALGMHIAWVPPGNVHLTLKFLGDDVAPADLDPIAAVMTECAQKMLPITLSAGGVGVFPDLRRPRVMWLGVAGDVRGLTVLQQDLDAGLLTAGKGRFKAENRPFRGHLTIGRIKSRVDSGFLIRALREMDRADSQPFTADAIHLIQSRLTSSGSIYTTLRSVMLGRNN